MLTRPFSLDMVPGGVPLVIHVSQYDSDQQLILSLFSSQGTLDIPASDVSAIVRGTKLDGNGIQYDCSLAFVADVPTVTVQLTQQMTAVAGKNPFEIVLTATDLNGNAYELPSATFYLNVKRAALDYDTIGSNSDIKEIADVMSKADQLIEAATDIKEAAEAIIDAGGASSADVEELHGEIDAVRETITELSHKVDTKVDGGYVSDNALYLVTDGSGDLGPFSGMGGGGGGGSDATLTVTNTTGWTSTTISSGSACPLSLTWSSVEDGSSTGNGTLTIYVGGVIKANMNVAQGSLNIDVAPYLATGDNSLTLRITDSTGQYKNRAFTITLVSLYLTSSFDDTVIRTTSFPFPYVPFGSVPKTVYFVLDGDAAGAESITTSASGRQLTYTVPVQTHGAHSIEVYMTAVINGETVRSESLYYEFAFVTSGGTAPVISTSYHETEVDQFTTVNIPYLVYTPGSQTSLVDISVNGVRVSEVTVDRTQQGFSWRLNATGTATIIISSGETSRTLTLTVNELDIDVEPAADSLALYLSSAGRSNNEPNPAVWRDTEHNVSCVFSHFTFASDGWLPDDQGIIAMRVKGDARLTIPYKIFSSDFRSTGKTIEVEFSSEDVMDYDAPILSCMYGGRGLVVTPQSCTLTSEQSSITMQYKEEEHVRVAFTIEASTGLRRMYCYINGINSGCIQYAADDDFEQSNPVDITVGSSLATINLYCIRVYDLELSWQQIVDNWTADCQDGATLVARYSRNKVYDAYGSIVINQLPEDLPYMILECAELPQYKGDKKTVTGSFIDPAHPEKSFTFTNCEANVQGTSSQYYKRKNYKLKFKSGVVMLSSGAAIEKYQLTEDCLPTNVFCLKADVASSEGANNVELVRLYCNACPYETPAQEENHLVRQGIDGFPMVLFWHDTVNDVTSFVGRVNFNLDKGAEECYGFEDGDESWEISNNTSLRVLWKSDDYTSTMEDEDGNEFPAWQNDFESRFPEDYFDPAQLHEFSSWMVRVDPDQATGNTLPAPVTYDETEYTADTAAYRKAKFRAELSNYVELDSTLFYYLFTELFLMVDSRAKNMFPSFIGTELS